MHQLIPINNSELFENSICDLFNRIENTISYKRFGRNGHNQKGIDIFSTINDTAIQCKKKDLARKYITLKKELLDDIKKDTKKIIKEKLKIKITRLCFVSTYKDDPEIDEFCESLKEEMKLEFDIVYWGWDTLALKFLDQKILLEKYWPNFVIIPESKELSFKRNLELKKNIEIDFKDWLNYPLNQRKMNSKIIIRQFDSEQYPFRNQPDEFGEYSWFGAEMKSLYYNGMEFIIRLEQIQIFEDNSWDVFVYGTEPIGKVISVAKVGQIKFEDVIDYDLHGDEHYICPHIFCRFPYNGTPFENTYYINLNKSYQYFENKNKRQNN